MIPYSKALSSDTNQIPNAEEEDFTNLDGDNEAVNSITTCTILTEEDDIQQILNNIKRIRDNLTEDIKIPH